MGSLEEFDAPWTPAPTTRLPAPLLPEFLVEETIEGGGRPAGGQAADRRLSGVSAACGLQASVLLVLLLLLFCGSE